MSPPHPGNDPQRPLSGYDLQSTGVHSVGHMSTLQGSRKWAGLGKQGEEFLTNAFHLLLPQLATPHRAALSLCWIRYEKLKVGRRANPVIILHCYRTVIELLSY